MQKIDLSRGRVGYDGAYRNQQEIEDGYVSLVKGKIEEKLEKLQEQVYNVQEKELVGWCLNKLDDLLRATPPKLKEYTEEIDAKYATVINPPQVHRTKKKRGVTSKTIKEKILYAFGYNDARSNELKTLAVWLNVKTCPYCNMNYILCIEDLDKNNTRQIMAKFQFDHFFDKATYPMLSMSLYNLIPSCPICNQGKSQTKLSLDFHPYHNSIGDTFKFAVVDPLKLYLGSKDSDIELNLEKQTTVPIDNYVKTFHIKKLYERHKDVAQEVFAKAYQESYYSESSNFSFVKDADFCERLKRGHYVKKDEIELRPMTKFQQDLWEQARDLIW